MEMSALAAALSAQTAMGLLVVKTLDQTQQMIKQQAANTIEQAQIPSVTADGIGESLDVIA
jgi:hypothetical protein